MPCLLPAGLLLMTSGEPLQQGWGVLAMIVLATLSLIAGRSAGWSPTASNNACTGSG